MALGVCTGWRGAVVGLAAVAADDQARAPEPSRVRSEAIFSSLVSWIVEPASDGGEGDPGAAVSSAMACRSDPGPASAVVVTTNSEPYSTAPRSTALPVCRTSPPWSVAGAEADGGSAFTSDATSSGLKGAAVDGDLVDQPVEVPEIIAEVAADVDLRAAERRGPGPCCRVVEGPVDVDPARPVVLAGDDDQVPGPVVDRPSRVEVEPVLPAAVGPPGTCPLMISRPYSPLTWFGSRCWMITPSEDAGLDPGGDAERAGAGDVGGGRQRDARPPGR